MVRRQVWYKTFKILSLTLAIFLNSFNSIKYENVQAAENEIIIKNLSTDKVRYSPGEKPKIKVELENKLTTSTNSTLSIKIYDKEKIIYSTSEEVKIEKNKTQIKEFNCPLPNIDKRGYLVKVAIDRGESKTTALDVCSSWSEYPRYGYIPNFGKSISKEDIKEQIDTLTNEYYVNSFQFYDWMWRHEVPIKRNNQKVENSWEDLFDRDIQGDVIKEYVDNIHNKNGKALAYMMSYASREGYDLNGVNPEWGLFQDKYHKSQLNVDFNNGKYLWLFAPSNKKWQEFISNSYKDCINTFGFDGIQIDQMGQRDNIFNYNGEKYDLENSFSSLVNAVKKELSNNNKEKSYIDFNIVDGTVNGWAVNDISKNAKTDLNFSEIWWKSNKYNELRNYIEQVRCNSKGKALVLAAYMNYNENTGVKYEAEDAEFKGPDIEKNHSGYTGKGFLQNFSHKGNFVQFNIDIDGEWTYPLIFQYGNNSENATRTIYVDGNKVGKANFYLQGTWDKFAFDSVVNVNLKPGKHKVKVVYENDDNGSINLDSLTIGVFNEPSIRLTDATMAASGATHIELGAGGSNDVSMLPHEYYPNSSKVMDLSLRNSMKNYYKFLTSYENLLFDSSLINGDSGDQSIYIDKEKISGDGKGESIWHINRTSTDYDILHLINLTSDKDGEWRNSTNKPTLKENLKIKQYFPKGTKIEGVFLASPDTNQCESKYLEYTTGNDQGGFYISYVVPSLEYWDMIYVKRNILSKNNIYEAEDAIKTNVGVNTNHTGYTGTGFIDGFSEMGDEVTFQIQIDKEKDYKLQFRYSNSTGEAAKLHLIIDGKDQGVINFNNLKDWESWSESTFDSHLLPGVHTIALYYDNNDSKKAINLDHLKILEK
ncbi:dextranase [Clostridium cavendishii DSM 21758]|uniref:Dextranase n=1 Tax=Clostridium cavendishii DSM 21758 TaxID=1121302 RepID=A0A1M6HV34_9CLOT|nr:glycoside hydrolase family 66 protein [Clostridium cavendishii]SHJ26102.1 dextranase [Clostridium cavendishii DSM 21758]